MSKYPFKSFDDIPLDNSGLQYPSLQELEFYFPPAALAANCHQLPERMRQKPVVTMINGLTLLRSLGVQAFNIDPRRWHKNKQPRRKQRGISEQNQLMIRMVFLILSTLIFHIFPYHQKQRGDTWQAVRCDIAIPLHYDFCVCIHSSDKSLNLY